jgi:hypothetical protein
MKLKLKDKHQIVAFHQYITLVRRIIWQKKQELRGHKATIDHVQINVLYLEINELFKKTCLVEYKAGHNVIKRSSIKITPIQGYIIILYLKESKSTSDKEFGEYVSHFIKEQSANIWKELLTK